MVEEKREGKLHACLAYEEDIFVCMYMEVYGYMYVYVSQRDGNLNRVSIDYLLNHRELEIKIRKKRNEFLGS